MDTLDIKQAIEEKKKQYEEKRKSIEETTGGKITLHTITLKDDEGKETGEVLAAFFKQPHLLVAALCCDMIGRQEVYQAGYKLWDSCFLPEHSSKEISQQDKYKLSLLPSVGLQLEMVSVDLKKN